MLECKRETTKERITNMSDEKSHLMFKVGKMPEISAKTIQKAYRRYKVRCYYYRLISTFQQLQIQKEEANFKTLRERLRNARCYLIIKEKKFLKYRKERLIKIKEKLALLTIKRVFKRNKWKHPVIIFKIKKYKRRLRAALKRKMKRREAIVAENLEKAFEQADAKKASDSVLSLNSEEDFETTTSDREAEEREKLLHQLEEERKQKIFYGKIAYNCRDVKFPKILTTRGHKEVALQVCESPVSQSLTKRVREKKEIKDEFEIRRRYDPEEVPSYMRATISFNLGKLDLKHENGFEFQPNGRMTPRENSTLFEPTKASMLKTTKKRSHSIDFNDSSGKYKRTASPKLISVFIHEKRQKTRGKTHKAAKSKDLNRDVSINLPEISTKYQVLPRNVKPRTEIMKGFTKTRRASDGFFGL